MTSTVSPRDAAGRVAGLSALFAPRGIAVIGASRTPGKLGATLARSLGGFAARGGHLALVNGRDDTMYPSVEYNRAAAGTALAHMEPRDPRMRLKLHAAALLAPCWQRAGAWLDAAPYGPRSGPPVPTGTKY